MAEIHKAKKEQQKSMEFKEASTEKQRESDWYELLLLEFWIGPSVLPEAMEWGKDIFEKFI